MKFAIWAAAAAAVVVGAAASAQAAEVLVTGSGEWGASTPSSTESAAGDSWSFSFDVTNPMSGTQNGSYFSTDPTNATFFLNGAAVSAKISEVDFFNSSGSGLFDIVFSNNDRVDLYGADVGSSGVPTLGVFSAKSDYNSEAGSAGSAGYGSGVVTLAAVAPAAVPEPATWAMLILGVAMIGYAARRRSFGAASAIAAA